MLKKFFEGRCGFDAYSLMLAILSLIFVQTRYLWVVSILLLAYVLFRALSRNKVKRMQELMQYNKFMWRYFSFMTKLFSGIAGFFSLQRKRFAERKSAVLTKCPQCSKVLRLPKDKGRIQATCPVCRHSFVMKT